ncbi:hypothetical protein ACFWNG_31880 [Streptomyces sp. NPDC058391]|uniref:hypothetical protein n=1 Tax=unclassified Streptomyces TaxID=2593676 RepID=UPI003656EE35
MEYRESGGVDGTTAFESMSHEEMLAWLDQAESGMVQGAADRLAAAAGEIRDIAQQLKFRPERVEWTGEGNQAFIDWGASLASATYRLADYSDEASKWMGRASDAIAEAQSAIPRDTAGAKANLAAATEARNDPDSAAVTSKSLETLAAGAERNRIEAAAQMRKLAQSYQQSQTQMGKLEVPTFRPPPSEFVPDDGRYGSGQDLARTGSGYGSGSSGGGDYPQSVRGGGAPENSGPSLRTDMLSPASVTRPERSTTTEIAGVGTQGPTLTAPPVAPNGAPAAGGPDGGGTPSLGITPAFGGGPSGNPGQLGTGRPVASPRPPLMPGQGGLTGGSPGRMPRDGGIVGGRPVPPNSGRPMGGIPRGTVIGGEGMHGRPPMGHGAGGGMGGTSPGQNGLAGGRRLAGETGGIVGGRPQQPGRTSARPFTPGGSGLVRGAAGEGRQAGGQMARGGAIPPRANGAQARQDDTRGERPDYLTEDEETWRQSGRRVVPPVIE